jgi:hypothetical protein
MGPISGDINIAPMMTAVEFTFSPIEAMKIAKMRIQRLVPLKSTFLLKDSMLSSGLAASP